jgi:hypothetical protein
MKAGRNGRGVEVFIRSLLLIGAYNSWVIRYFFLIFMWAVLLPIRSQLEQLGQLAQQVALCCRQRGWIHKVSAGTLRVRSTRRACRFQSETRMLFLCRRNLLRNVAPKPKTFQLEMGWSIQYLRIRHRKSWNCKWASQSQTKQTLLEGNYQTKLQSIIRCHQRLWMDFRWRDWSLCRIRC